MNVLALARPALLFGFCLVVGASGPGRADPAASPDPRQALGCGAVDAAAKQANGALLLARGAFDAKARESMSQKVCRTAAVDVAGAAGGLLVLRHVAMTVNSLAPKGPFTLPGDFAAGSVALRKLAEQDCSAPVPEREKLWLETVRLVHAELAPSTTACGIDPKTMTTLFRP